MDKLVIDAVIRMLSRMDGGRMREPANPFRSQVTLPSGSILSVTVEVADLPHDAIVAAGTWHQAKLTFLTLPEGVADPLDGLDAFVLTEGNKVVGAGQVQRGG